MLASATLVVGASPAQAEFNPKACIAKFGINWQMAYSGRDGQIWRPFGWSWPWESQKCPQHIKMVRTNR